jgi:hypothetical protein
MLLGVIADDFTGASDIANTLTKGVGGQGGLRSALFQGIPALQAAQGIEAGIVALKSRSVPVDQAVAQSLAALEWLLAQGCRQIVFKYCSTFDSTPQGNIGPVAEALAERLGTKAVVVCPAFPEAGRTVYQGHLFVQDRPLHESGMQNHPLNPMTDPDLRRWLQRQCTGKVGHLRWQEVAQGKTRISEALGASDATLIVVDALTVEDLVTIGHASASAPLLTGGSGIASGLPAISSRRTWQGAITLMAFRDSRVQRRSWPDRVRARHGVKWSGTRHYTRPWRSMWIPSWMATSARRTSCNLWCGTRQMLPLSIPPGHQIKFAAFRTVTVARWLPHILTRSSGKAPGAWSKRASAGWLLLAVKPLVRLSRRLPPVPY